MTRILLHLYFGLRVRVRVLVVIDDGVFSTVVSWLHSGIMLRYFAGRKLLTIHSLLSHIITML